MMNGLPVFVFDQGKAQLTGVELSANHQVTDWLAVNAAAEAVNGELRGSGDELPLLPADNVRAGVVLDQPRLGALDQPYLTADVRYVASKDAAPGEPFSQFDGAPFGTASTSSYTRVDIGGGFALDVQGRVVNLDLAVTNLFDEDYRDFLDTYKGYALSPGRDIRLTLRSAFGGE
jgi:iron complex outermembrane receptor protein/hemoglobin/transferrin/lactoferrin receptor protein